MAGLARMSSGGEAMLIQASSTSGNGLRLTGQLGGVTKESVQIVRSHVRSHASDWRRPPDVKEGRQIHVHLPWAAVPKDGPSAGVTLVTALMSTAAARRAA